MQVIQNLFHLAGELYVCSLHVYLNSMVVLYGRDLDGLDFLSQKCHPKTSLTYPS